MITFKPELENPGVLVMVKCLDTICMFLGKNKEELLKDHKYDCRRLYKKIQPDIVSRVQFVLKQFDKLKNFDQTEDILLQQLDRNKINKFIKTMFQPSCEGLLIDLLVPVEKRLEINEFNIEKVLKMYFSLFIRKNDVELKYSFMKFLLRGNNFKIIPFKIGNITEDQYWGLKRNAYLHTYESYIRKLQESFLSK